MSKLLALTVAVLSVMVMCTTGAEAASASWKAIRVSATAYNALPRQTSRDNPSLAAWGDVLRPGMHAIAVSRDLIERGLTRGTRVKIQGLSGIYVVLDKMARRWHKKIDIFMGHNLSAARDWGIHKNIRIRWRTPQQ